MEQCNTRENMSLYNFFLFHLRKHVKNSDFLLHSSKQMKICFSIFVTRDEAFSLVFDVYIKNKYV